MAAGQRGRQPPAHVPKGLGEGRRGQTGRGLDLGVFDIVIWAGAGVTLAGVAGLVACIVYVLRQRRAGLDEATLRSRLQRGVVWNMAALFISVIGLMLVVVGIALT
ncbi:MAG: Cbb3-type cytochrome oxidase component FixQ [Rhodobacteraceae bacterium HLUCCA12]|nr:MAG: Cbb3-type cytochrome oxidase component FixQ [Rhodobacteraceae bacterium HLUCCA12]